MALDCSIKKGLELAEGFLNHPGVRVEILTLIQEENYLEIGLVEETSFT